MSEQQGAEALCQVPGAQLVPGAVQTDSSQVPDHAEQGQAVLGWAGGRAGHATQHLGAVLQVSDLCGWTENRRVNRTASSSPELASGSSFDLTLNGADHVSLQRGREDGTRQILQESDDPVAQGRHLQLLQV